MAEKTCPNCGYLLEENLMCSECGYSMKEDDNSDDDEDFDYEEDY